MQDIKAKILSNDQIIQGYFKMTLDAPGIARSAKPGQFVQIRCSDSYDPLLRRPFSIHRLKVKGERLKGIEILYEVVGRGTEILSQRKKGEFIDVLGPLGKGFTFSRTTNDERRTTILVAGGIGVAPLVFLAQKLSSIEHRVSSIKTVVLIGAKTKKHILCQKDFKKLGCEVHIATDDGSRGYRGFVSELLESRLRRTRGPSTTLGAGERRGTIYACGPNPMLKCVADISKEHGIECQVSLEEKMACGFGACLGCAVKVKSGRNKLVCKDGPVFRAEELILD